MKLFLKIILASLIYSSVLAENFKTNNCPPIDNNSYPTQNSYGKSTYKAIGMDEIIDLLIKNGVNLSKPILDAGSGYGPASYALLQRGSKNLYINDLSKENMVCLQHHMRISFPEKKDNVHYLVGDISESAIFNQIPASSLNLIFAVNVIHFFSAQQIVNFFKESSIALEKDGILYLVFENPLLIQQQDLIKDIDKKLDATNKGVQIDHEIVAQQYKLKAISNNLHCSAQDYLNTPGMIKTNGFPCTKEINGIISHYQLLVPEILAVLLEHFGFSLIGVNYQKNEYGTIHLLARKQ